MEECVIDYCEGRDEKILTVTTEGDPPIRLGFCGVHAGALRDRFAAQLGVDPRYVDMRKYGGTIGELQEAIDYLDSEAAANEQRTEM